jgi:hypothetical protein
VFKGTFGHKNSSRREDKMVPFPSQEARITDAIFFKAPTNKKRG